MIQSTHYPESNTSRMQSITRCLMTLSPLAEIQLLTPEFFWVAGVAFVMWRSGVLIKRTERTETRRICELEESVGNCFVTSTHHRSELKAPSASRTS